MNNQSEIELEFAIGHCNGTMSMEIFVNDLLATSYASFDCDHVTFKHTVPWPCTIKITVSGKDLSRDTRIDDAGNILADKYIELKKVTVDRCEAGLQFMQSIQLVTNDTVLNKVYWGFNGCVYLNLDHSDSFMWHMISRTSTDKNYIIVDHTKI
jgi:hypothetical protein